MRVAVQGRHVVLTDAMKDFAADKGQGLGRRFGRIQSVDITFRQSNATYEAKVVVHLPRNHTVVCTEKARSFDAALDSAIGAVERRLAELKDRMSGDDRATRRIVRAEKGKA